MINCLVSQRSDRKQAATGIAASVWSYGRRTAPGAALAFPKNANVAATIALAGIGFDTTRVRIVADPTVTENIHELKASGSFGSFAMSVAGRPLPSNPKTSSLAAMSVLRCIENRKSAIVI